MLCLLGMEGILLAAWVDRVAPAQPLQALTRGKQGPGGTARPLGPPEDRVALEGDAPLVQQKDTRRSNDRHEARADPKSPAAASSGSGSWWKEHREERGSTEGWQGWGRQCSCGLGQPNRAGRREKQRPALQPVW